MPERKTTAKRAEVTVDPLSVFRWSDTGLDHVLGLPHYGTEREARRAWEQWRRAVWERTTRFTLPGPAQYYDGLSLHGLRRARDAWSYVVDFPLDEVLELLAEDRENLARFAATKGGRAIADILALVQADLDMIEHTARDLATYPAGTWRPHPGHLNVSLTYGGGPDVGA